MEKREIYQNPQLDGSTFFWKSGDVAVLCLHGFTATTVEVRKMAAFLTSIGYTTYGPLLPGHGTDIEDMLKARWQDWVKTVEESYSMLKNDYKQVFVLGESMGALLALYLCEQHPEIPGTLLFAPALRIRKFILPKLLWPFVKYKFKNYSKDGDDMPWQGYDVIPMRPAASLYDFQQIVKKKLSKVTAPVLIFQGKLDTTIDPTGSVTVLENINSTDKELVWLEDSGHVILLDRQLEDAQLLTQDFLARHAA